MAAAPHATRALALLAVALLGFAGVSNACFQLLGSAAETPEGQALAKPFAEAGAW